MRAAWIVTHSVTLGQEKLRQIGSILSGNSSDESDFSFHCIWCIGEWEILMMKRENMGDCLRRYRMNWQSGMRCGVRMDWNQFLWQGLFHGVERSQIAQAEDGSKDIVQMTGVIFRMTSWEHHSHFTLSICSQRHFLYDYRILGERIGF